MRFETPTFEQECEVTGHPIVRLSMSLGAKDGSSPREMDVFVTLRHYGPEGSEGWFPKHNFHMRWTCLNNGFRVSGADLCTCKIVFYTGTTGDPVPISKGWLRVSLRKVDESHQHHRPYLPYRSYYSTDVQPVELDKVYTFDVEIWPTNVVVAPGGRFVLEVASGDSQGSGIFEHNHPEDRGEQKLLGINSIHIDDACENFVLLPVIPGA